MILNDYKCLQCEKVATDKEEAPTCCGKKMDKILANPPAIWKTPGFTRPKAFPKKEENK